ncbi:MAG: hypothetical protein NVS3B21_14100 [Acidimicrobiales bacterium]
MVATPPTPRRGGGYGLGRGRWLGPAAVLVPVKAFSEAKVRLAPALPPDERAALARTMAAGVISAARPLPVAVVCDDREVAGWARSMDALVIWEPGRGLNGAVEAGISQLSDAGVERVVVAHADLPMAAGLAALSDGDGVILVPDRSRDGTNVAVVPARAGFRFSYGPGSFARHLLEADRLNLGTLVVDDPLLAFDVDWPDDLTTLAAHRRSGR